MTNAIQPFSRIQAFAGQPVFSLQESKQESLDDLLYRTSRQIAEKERLSKTQLKYPFITTKEIVAWLAEFSVNVEDADELRAAILKALDKKDCREFKTFMKLALKTNHFEPGDLVRAEGLVDLYEMNESDIKPLYEIYLQLKEIERMEELARGKRLA